MTGVIIKALSGSYYIEAQGCIYECKARGRFRKSGIFPLVGDRVEITDVSEAQGVIDNILPRKNAIARPAVANIDKMIIVSAFMNPRPNTAIIDKMTVIARYNGITPIIVFNECDTGDFADLQKIYENAGFKVYVMSAKENTGFAALEEELKDCISVFTGNSGVGKSSILNGIFGNSVIATGEVSEKLGRGRHTTRHTELYKLPNGGFVADTPGFSSFELDTCDYALKERLADCFYDFDKFASRCRFPDCTHTKEAGCAVLEAVKNGDIEPSRHSSYMYIFDEMKDLKPWHNKNKQQ